MANAENYFGLRPIRHFNGAPWNGQTMRCYLAAGESNALYLGDPVALTATTDDVPTDGKSIGVMKATVTSGGHIFGVITSFETTADYETVYRVADTARYCQVCLANDIVFRIRGCGEGTPVKQWQGLNAVMIAGSGSTVTGLSGVRLDEGTTTVPAANQAYTLVILHVSDVEDNELGDHAQWDVIINTPQLLANVAGRYLGIATS